ncbi:hypothetical protein OPKNFCMD_1852 [Methylobacterium crusticola]|uniref:DUF1330 domain-containing protein n=1 Tax=Methylobacterium crusticola TaxID=1697972 RepID=A0ABQ4QUU8_9HYPH|nr:hypothetical protein [Methylobacterium crusticola]GJD49122.1 hypothetical protein OPKNFCMD_1852 [Methylobacterium crusticola]
MIDIVKILREQHPDLGPYVIALRERSGLVAPEAPGTFADEVRDWSAAEAPSAALSLRSVTYAPFPGLPEETRTLGVVAFANAADLARFATRWT